MYFPFRRSRSKNRVWWVRTELNCLRTVQRKVMKIQLPTKCAGFIDHMNDNSFVKMKSGVMELILKHFNTKLHVSLLNNQITPFAENSVQTFSHYAPFSMYLTIVHGYSCSNKYEKGLAEVLCTYELFTPVFYRKHTRSGRWTHEYKFQSISSHFICLSHSLQKGCKINTTQNAVFIRFRQKFQYSTIDGKVKWTRKAQTRRKQQIHIKFGKQKHQV